MRRSRYITALLALVVVGLTVAPTSSAAPPTNDNFDDATSVTSLPFTQTVSIVEATTEPGEPGTPWSAWRTVWWTFAPSADMTLRTTQGGCCPFLSVFRADGGGFAGLTPITGTWTPYGQAYALSGGTTYYFQSGDTSSYGWTTEVTLTLDEVLPPANDDFADATSFSAVPYSDAPDLTAATLEPGEPTACGAGATRSVWYAFTPTTSGTYGYFYASGVGVYTGTSLENLTNLTCSDWTGLYFHAEAGTTYYIQATEGGINIDLIPPPDPGWDFSPSDPSRFDEITFRHGFGYWHPRITTYAWDFGDGTSATVSENAVTHRYSADGDYTVTLTVTAKGGDTASETHTVHVRTHDVSILWSSVPARARLGRAIPIQVGIGNTRYAETVRVDFYKLTPAGSVFLGTVTKPVPVLNAKKTVMFSYDYGVTNDDLAVGKLGFQAVATIEGARDAFPADNTTTMSTSVAR
jgi:hypothetical protein